MANRITKAKLNALYAAIGRFILTWSEIELYLDLLVIHLHKHPERMPHQLQAKIKFIRERVQSSKSRPATEATRLLAEIEGLADTRHDYVHGARVGHSFSRSELVVKLGRFLQPESRPRRVPVKVTATEISNTTDRLYEIGGELLDVLDALLGSSINKNSLKKVSG